MLLDQIVEAVEAAGWEVRDRPQGYQLVPDDEPIGFTIEEKLEPKPQVPTPAELKEVAEYEKKCALAARGIGYRPWRAPQIPEHDYHPNGHLVLKLDGGRSIEGLRRTFSDGKRQRLEDLLPALLQSLRVWSEGQKALQARQEQWRQDYEAQEARRRATEDRSRTDNYRSTFLARQAERLDEIARIDRLLGHWGANVEEPALRRLMGWAVGRREQLSLLLQPSAAAMRIEALRLMDDDVHIYDLNQIG